MSYDKIPTHARMEKISRSDDTPITLTTKHTGGYCHGQHRGTVITTNTVTVFVAIRYLYVGLVLRDRKYKRLFDC